MQYDPLKLPYKKSTTTKSPFGRFPFKITIILRPPILTPTLSLTLTPISNNDTIERQFHNCRPFVLCVQHCRGQQQRLGQLAFRQETLEWLCFLDRQGVPLQSSPRLHRCRAYYKSTGRMRRCKRNM